MHETAHMRTISCIRSYEYYIMSLILVCKQRKVNSFLSYIYLMVYVLLSKKLNAKLCILYLCV